MAPRRPQRGAARRRVHEATGSTDTTRVLRDFARGGSDRPIDAIVARGDIDAIVERLQAHLDAGADHVAVSPLSRDPRRLPLDPARKLAGALGLRPQK